MSKSRKNALGLGWLLCLCQESSALVPGCLDHQPSLHARTIAAERVNPSVSYLSRGRTYFVGLRSSNRDSSPNRPEATDQKEFWLKQKELLRDLSDVSNKAVRARQREKFARQRLALVSDTAFLGILIFCGLWSGLENPFVALSYALGTSLGVAYAYGLGKYVENLGSAATAYDAEEAGKGAGVGEARFAFLILLFVLVGKFRDAGLEVVPTIAGFFTYQIASLAQGLKPDDADQDDE